MQLHQIKPINKNKSKKRVGRGGKRGTYSGRGTKGQRSRSGHRIRPAERDLIQRLPKLRGLKNKSLKPKATVIKLSDLENKIKDGIVNKKTLIESGLIKKSVKEIKIVGDGTVKKALTIEGIKVSKSAENKIKNAGGAVKNE
ncbi:50S ribosomal protein L15 [Candidatus Wolfebacteria bacterium]|nr:50S ribosomal protein L15 [Candidatus Wolfebacteria bacterium]